jgi:hypothetical protein
MPTIPENQPSTSAFGPVYVMFGIAFPRYATRSIGLARLSSSRSNRTAEGTLHQLCTSRQKEFNSGNPRAPGA